MKKNIKDLQQSLINPRRDFLQKASLGGLALGGLSLSGFTNKPIEETLEYSAPNASIATPRPPTSRSPTCAWLT